jgi:hypothetical protein
MADKTKTKQMPENVSSNYKAPFTSHTTRGWYSIKCLVSKRANSYCKEIKVSSWLSHLPWADVDLQGHLKISEGTCQWDVIPVSRETARESCGERYKAGKVQTCFEDKNKANSKSGSFLQGIRREDRSGPTMATSTRRLGRAEKLQSRVRKVNH